MRHKEEMLDLFEDAGTQPGAACQPAVKKALLPADGCQLMTVFAGLQVVCVMAGIEAIGDIVGLDYLRFVLERDWMWNVTFRAFRYVRFLCVRDILVRRHGLAAGCFVVSCLFGELVKGPVTGEAFLGDGLFIRALSAVLWRRRSKKSKGAEKKNRYGTCQIYGSLFFHRTHFQD
jgi:hypothetical protein